METLHLDVNDKCHTFLLHPDKTVQSRLNKYGPYLPTECTA